MLSNFNNQNSRQRFAVTFVAIAAISYCLVVIWYVATFPDVGVRCLLPTDPNTDSLYITQFTHSPEDCLSEEVKPDQQIYGFAGRPATNFLAFIESVANLRTATIPPGGQLPAGSDPSARAASPALVEIAAAEDTINQSPRRMVKIDLRKPLDVDPGQYDIHTWVAIKPLEPGSFILTIFSFVCQLMILGVAMTAFWQRPGDRVVRTFCLMCCAWMPAFVGGFHWWVLAASPILNLPFIIAGCLLPAVTLHFFLSFPRENVWLSRKRVLATWVIYTPATLAAVVIAFVYWAAWSLNAVNTDHLSVFQKLAALSGRLSHAADVIPSGYQLSSDLLYVLRVSVFSGIVLSCTYFGLTIVSLGYNLWTTTNAMERSQASGILTASLIATIPIVYTLYLAFHDRSAFALGNAKQPMFFASALFMTAYAHGMLKHRLILVNEVMMRGRRHLVVSSVVTGICAVLLAVAVVATRVYALPPDTSLVLQMALFFVLVLGVSFVLWARDKVQALVDHQFFAEKYQLDRTLQQLNQASGYLSDPVALGKMTLQACEDVVACSGACLYLKDSSGSFRLIAAQGSSGVPGKLTEGMVGAPANGDVIVRRSSLRTGKASSETDLLLDMLGAELLCFLQAVDGIDGLIVIGKRTNGVAYSAEDVAFLQATCQMTELALNSSRANQNLAQVNSELKMKMDRIAEQQRQLAILRAELTSLQEGLGDASKSGLDGDTDFDRGNIRGNSPAIRSVLQTSRKAADSAATVLIRGESGTGKELLAQVVHRNSNRADKPLVTINCAALAPSLLESELFGHVKGAFTGAASDKAGRFQAAHTGTLFLDEIGDVSLEIQVKLLRVLQERQFEPVGSSNTVDVDVRVIAATNRNLEEMIESGDFREDLYYRLNVISIALPALRERREDLIELVFYFLNRASQKTDKKIHHIDPDALQLIEEHAWPGNIRELENAIERAVVLADTDTIMAKDLPPQMLAAVQKASGARKSKSSSASKASGLQDSSSARRASKSPVTASPDTLPSPGVSLADIDPPAREGQSESSAENVAEHQLLRRALELADGNKALAARSLKMPRSTFYSKLKKHDL